MQVHQPFTIEISMDEKRPDAVHQGNRKRPGENLRNL
jgi:hypothetical protein